MDPDSSQRISPSVFLVKKPIARGEPVDVIVHRFLFLYSKNCSFSLFVTGATSFTYYLTCQPCNSTLLNMQHGWLHGYQKTIIIS